MAIELPPVVARYLVDVLHDLDWSEAAGMGAAPLSCREIRAWQECSDTVLDPWEFDLIRGASRAYVGQLNSEETVPPYSEQEHVRKPAVGAFAALARKLNRKSDGTGSR